MGIARLGSPRPGRVRRLAALAGCAAVTLLNAGAATSRPAAPARAFDDAEECTEAVPAASSIAGITDDGRVVRLDVHVLLDGVSVDRAQEVVRQAAQAYRPLRIELAATYEEVSFPAQRNAVEFLTGPSVPTSDYSYLVQKSKDATGGARPADADVVYLLTSDRITGGVAGFADCIGGVRYPNRAFAVGEEEPDSQRVSVALCCTWSTAKIAAHEIAHLLGAHHHYANCVEGATTAVADRHLGTCTMMFNDVGLVNLHFSALEAAVIRGHALAYADRAPAGEGAEPTSPPTSSPEPDPTAPPAESPTPSPTPPPAESPSPSPEPEASPQPTPSPSPEPTASPEPPQDHEDVRHLRSVSLRLSRHLVARGRVDAGAATSCSDGVTVTLQQRTGGTWREVGTTTTGSGGRWRMRLTDEAGRYRVVASEVAWSEGNEYHTCVVAASDPVRHRHRS